MKQEVLVFTQSLKLGDRVGSLIAICASSSDLVEAVLLRPADLPQAIMLMAPLPGLAPARLEDVEGATVVQALPALHSGQSELIAYSLPRFFSLEPPLSTLQDLLPGLQEGDRITVNRIGAEDMELLMKDLPSPFQIIIDLPGAEAEVIKALEDAAVLDRAAVLELRCGVEPFFPKAQGVEELINSLSALDFVLQHRNDEDPDWPVLRFNSDLIAKENRSLKSALIAAQAERDTAEQALNSARADLAVAVRMQTLAQGDLRDLQGRFAEGERQRHQQAELLRKLAPRLLIAAEQLADMIASSPAESPKAVLSAAPVTKPGKAQRPPKAAEGKL